MVDLPPEQFEGELPHPVRTLKFRPRHVPRCFLACGQAPLPTTPRRLLAAYHRTSSAANVGEDKDSTTRQRLAIERYAKAAGLEIVAEFADEAGPGADPVETRPGFAAMLERMGSSQRLLITVR